MAQAVPNRRGGQVAQAHSAGKGAVVRRVRLIAPLLGLLLALGGCGISQSDYDQGLAAHRDQQYETALSLLLRAAQNGNHDAMAIAGGMLVMGQGGTKDPIEGVRWLRKAAESGHTAAQAMLGTLYTFGTAVKQDANEARHWLGQAAKQGDGQAAVLLNKLNGKTQQAM